MLCVMFFGAYGAEKAQFCAQNEGFVTHKTSCASCFATKPDRDKP